MSGGENILIKADQNNLIYIDPNSVSVGGDVKPRSVTPENLVMYVNLEADLVSRSVLTTNSGENQLVSVADGVLNFLSNKNGGDFDTRWTESYTDINLSSGDAHQTDATTQSFGISNISIDIRGANFIPRVTINFIDVRGKTLFESPENSPYNAFFHIPWPVFYLTVKGYYGKAIRYRLHLVKFNSKYNPANGNFEIDTQFVGSTYAYLADISLESILAAPYFYGNHTTKNVKFNENTGEYERVVDKSSKGFRILSSVYKEYISKGLLPKDFPVRTLGEIIGIAGRLNKILEREIFSEVVDPKTLSSVKEYEDTIKKFEQSILSWKTRFLSSEYFTDNEQRIDPISGESEIVQYNIISGPTKGTTKIIVGSREQGTLEFLVNQYINLLETNDAFGQRRKNKIPKSDKVKPVIISCDGLKPFNKFYKVSQTVGVDINGILNEIYSIQKKFVEQRNKIELNIEKFMNEVVKRKDVGIGFEPTVRNIVGVLLANADVYIRLMKDVHISAMERSQDRKVRLRGVNTDSISQNDNIFPWPEVKSKTSGGKELILQYPGSREMVGKLQSDDKSLWPEVDFVENFYSIVTKRSDNLMGSNGNMDNVINIYPSDEEITDRELGILSTIFGETPYGSKSFSNVIYEIYERAKYTLDLMPYSNNTVHQLAKMEFENIKSQLSYDVDVLEMLNLNIKKYKNEDFGRDLLTTMLSTSPFERYPYYEDQIPTVGYIKDSMERGFDLSHYNGKTQSLGIDDYIYLQDDVKDYKPQDYRKLMYPFNCDLYLGYLGKTELTTTDLKTNNFVQLSSSTDMIVTPPQPMMWVKNGFSENLFTNTIKIDGQEKHILNTPYFHKQLYDEFMKTQTYGKYVGSSYIFLMSLPFVDLDDTIRGGDYSFFTNYGINPSDQVLVSTLFKEQPASHFLPYHLILKWGAIYHRYKKYITDGVDIISGVTTSIDGDVYFDNSSGLTFTNLIDSKEVTRSEEKDIGFHPFYESIYHQITNGYTFLNTDDMVNSYGLRVGDNTIKLKYRESNGVNAWSSMVDNSKFDPNTNTYTLLPTNGNVPTNGETFNLSEQDNFRVLWGLGTSYYSDLIDYTSKTLPEYNEYFKSIESEFSLDENYRKLIDLIHVFKPQILDEFELLFLDFASEKMNEEVLINPISVAYPKFQDILSDISKIEKTEEVGDIFETIITKQNDKLKQVTNRILSNNNIMKLTQTNPREYDPNVFGGFTENEVKRFTYGTFNLDQMVEGVRLIELYLGEDLEGYYNDFFVTMDMEVTSDNVIKFRPLIYLYGGLRSSGVEITKDDFKTYVNDTIINHQPIQIGIRTYSNPSKRLEIFLTDLIRYVQTIPYNKPRDNGNIVRGYNDDPIKLELYNYFKSFNDKWTSGNSIGQKLLMEEFLFLDRANKDIGNSVYLSMDKLLRLLDPKNSKSNLYSVISLLVQDTGFDIRTLPAYVNYYNPNSSSKKIIPSKTVAESLFGTFMEVDYMDSSPKIILQYVGPTSKHLELSDINKKYRYKNDGVDIGNVHNNPIIVAPDVFRQTDFNQSNRVVAFEVSFGDQNQSIFKGVNLDQSSIRNTSESFEVLERLGRSETGSNTAQVDIGLWDIYRQSSYQCEVTCMGNVMIQPTMYFYLKNVPMFRGSYWITEVSHNISLNRIETRFKGTRIPAQSLPDPSDSFLASYRSLFDKLVKKSVSKVLEEQNRTTTEKTLVMSSGEYVFDPGTIKPYTGENMIKRPGMTEYGIPYNGFDGEKYVQLISFEEEDNRWLRAVVVEMGGSNNPIDDNVSMSIVSRLTTPTIDVSKVITWGDLKNNTTTSSFYSTKFNLMKINPDFLINNYLTSVFFNPKYRREIVIPTNISTVENIYNGPVSVGPGVNGYGIGMSKYLMKQLSVYDGDVVYFKLI